MSTNPATLNLIKPAEVVPTAPSPMGMFNVPGCTFTPTALIIERGMKVDDWISLGVVLRNAGEGVRIWLGDWIRYGQHEYGHKYDEALAKTGYKAGTLRDSVWVANKVPIKLRLASADLSPRGDNLKFQHYKNVAPLGKVKLIKKWLERALKGDGNRIWSASRLKKEITKASQPPESELPTFSAALKSLHDKAVRDDLDSAIADLKLRIAVCPDPILATTYRRAIEMFEWQKGRTLENDVTAIVRIFSASEGTEAPERVSEDYISVWLREHGFIMGDAELEDRLKLMVRIRMFTVEDRKKSKNDQQSGVVTPVYAPDIDFSEKIDAVDELPTRAERVAAMRDDWKRRIARYAPEFVESPPTDKVGAPCGD